MSRMQAEAAAEVPGSAPIAAYLDHLPQAVPADLLGCLVASEAEAMHQVLLFVMEVASQLGVHWVTK